MEFRFDYDTVKHEFGEDVADIIWGECLPEFVREATRLLEASGLYMNEVEKWEGGDTRNPVLIQRRKLLANQLDRCIGGLKIFSSTDPYMQGLAKGN